MTTSSNTEIEQLKEYISDRFDKIDKDITELKISVARVEEKVTGIDKRLDSVETRVKDQDNRFWTLIVGAFLALFGLLTKMAFFPGGNP